MARSAPRVVAAAATLGATEVVPGLKSNTARNIIGGVASGGIVPLAQLAAGGGGGLSTPSPPNAPPPVTTATPAVQQAQADAIARRGRAKGFQSTVLRSFLESNNSTDLKSTFGS